MGSPRLLRNEHVWTEVVVNVNARQIQIAGTLDQLSKHQTDCQFLNHWLVGKLIGMGRRTEKRVVEEGDK